MLEGLPYIAILLLLLLLLLVLFLTLLFIFLFLLCASRLSTRQSKVDGTLATRFGPVSPELEAEVRSILDESVLDSVMELAAFSPDLKHFQAEMRAIPRPPQPWDPAPTSPSSAS